MPGEGIFKDLEIEHARYVQAYQDLSERIELARLKGGGIVPLLGPTRCGKTELLRRAHSEIGEEVRGPGLMIADWNFVTGSIPPKPNDADLYRAMLTARGYAYGKTERTPGLRSRVTEIVQSEDIAVIALDECSHCAEPGANLSARSATDHFKALVDTTGVVLVLSGLPKFQKLISDNEQFRDRSMRTVELHPYQWVSEQDRNDFMEAVFPLLEAMGGEGYELDVDEIDLARRLYGASGGRVGRVVELLSHTLNMMRGRRKVSLADFARAGQATIQVQHNLPDMFEAASPSDSDLERAYVRVMQEAGLPVPTVGLETFAALRAVGQK